MFVIPNDLLTLFFLITVCYAVKYHCIVAGIQKEVCSMCIHWGLVGDWPVAQGHTNNGSHMGFRTKHMNGNTGGLPCKKKNNKLN